MYQQVRYLVVAFGWFYQADKRYSCSAQGPASRRRPPTLAFAAVDEDDLRQRLLFVERRVYNGGKPPRASRQNRLSPRQF